MNTLAWALWVVLFATIGGLAEPTWKYVIGYVGGTGALVIHFWPEIKRGWAKP